MIIIIMTSLVGLNRKEKVSYHQPVGTTKMLKFELRLKRDNLADNQ